MTKSNVKCNECDIGDEESYKLARCKKCNFHFCGKCLPLKHDDFCSKKDYEFINIINDDKFTCFYCQGKSNNILRCRKCYFVICQQCRKSHP